MDDAGDEVGDLTIGQRAEQTIAERAARRLRAFVLTRLVIDGRDKLPDVQRK